MKRPSIRKWVNLTKTLLIALAPIYIPAFLIIYFGFRIEPILASILFVQIYVLIAQAEAMLRQAEWSRAAYDAIFRVSADVRDLGTIVTVANSGDKPAYNFFVGLRDETEGRPLEHSLITSGIPEVDERDTHTLSPGRQHVFHLPLAGEEFQKRAVMLTISYDNVLGHTRDVRAMSFEGREEFLMLRLQEAPGFLIRAYEDLMLYTRWYFVFRRWTQRKQKTEH